MRLAGKVAIISGAASGMGAATARMFAREGAKVVIGDVLEHEGRQVAESTLTAIMGRMSAYTGKLITWEQAMNSKLDLWPKEPLAFGPFPVAPVATPGKDPLV